MAEDFETTLIEKLKKKNLTDSTISFYLRNLRKLNNDKEIKNLNFLNNEESIEKIIEGKKPNTKRNYYITIVSILGVDSKKKTLLKHYREKMDKINKDLKEEEGKNEKSETQKKNWIEKKELDEIYDKYKEEVNKFKNEKDLTPKKYDKLLKYVILSLYTLIAPRRNKDYQESYMVKGIPEKDLSDNINYIDITKKKLIFNNFKTVKTEGEQKIDIPDDLMNVLNIYIKFHPLIELNEKKFEVPFLVDDNGLPLPNVNSLTVILNRIFKKNIGSSMLRHMYLSNKYGNILEEQKEDAKNMGHSVEMQKDYIKK